MKLFHTFFIIGTVICLVAAQPIQLTAQQPTGWTSWADVMVHYTLTSPATSQDWIGAFLTTWNVTYIKYQPVRQGDTNGSLTFNLLNGRHPYVFVYYRNNDVLASSNVVFPAGATPQQGHLTLISGHPELMIVSWASNRTSAHNGVAWGYSPDRLVNTAKAFTASYAAQDFVDCMGYTPAVIPTPIANLGYHSIRCDYNCYDDRTAPSFHLDPGFLHNATIGPIAPGTSVVYYKFGELNHDDLMSPVYTFNVLNQPGDASTFTFIYTADMGIGTPNSQEVGGATHNDPPANGADEVIAAMIKDPLLNKDQFVLVNGDISYARGWPWIWERYMDLIQPIATKMPWMVTIGNHEYDYSRNSNVMTAGQDSGGECGVPATKRFHLPDIRTPWYYFDAGSARVVTISSEHDSAPQIAWFQSDVLKSYNRTKTPWLIVLMHRPMYGSFAYDPVSVDLTKKWSALFDDSGVDMVLTGHQHYYERDCAVINGSCAGKWIGEVDSVIGCSPSLPVRRKTLSSCKHMCLRMGTFCGGVKYHPSSKYCEVITTNETNCFSSAMQTFTNVTVFKVGAVKAPVYIIDGSAGAEFSPYYTVNNPIVEDKDFGYWGYSRISVSDKTLSWTHYHTDNQVADFASLQK